MTARITVLADTYNGKQLNSPNDVVVKSDGSVWFSDPTFGILGYYEGHKAESENTPAVYRLDPATGKLTMMADDMPGPNGLAFSPDEKKLYVVASRAEPHRTIVGYDVSADGTKLGNGKVLIDAGPGGSPDGFRVDVDGNLWCGWGMGSPSSTACASSTRTASRSAISTCRSAAPTSASAAATATACS